MTHSQKAANNLQLDYRLTRENRDDLVFNIDLNRVLDDGLIGIFGDSGTGKSTLLKALAGLMKGAKYQFSIRNPANEFQEYKNLSATLNPCVYLGEDSILFDHLSVLANLRLVQKHGEFTHHAKLSFDQVVSMCSIENLLEQNASELSSGESQRVKFARALLSGKPCILLDEAFSALDWGTRQYFANLVVRLHQSHGFCFVMVSHSLRELAICCTHLIHLREGRIEKRGAVDSMVNSMVDYLQDSHTHKHTPENDLAPLVSNNDKASRDVFSLLEIKVVGYDQQARLVECVLNDEQANTNTLLIRSSSPFSIDSIHRFTIDADKVSLSTSINANISMLNCIRGEVEAIDRQDSVVIITLRLGHQKLRSAISIRSFDHLSIKKGDELFALFKAL